MKEHEGVEQTSATELTDAELLELVRAGRPSFLRDVEDAKAAKIIKKRYDRLTTEARLVQNELRVNYLRYRGFSFAQVHPRDPNRIYMPPVGKGRTPPTLNKIRRMVHRYVAQTTADEPIIEGVPSNHTDDARDAAESATDALRSEWQRLKLQNELSRVAEYGGIMRSGFWHFQWNPVSGAKVPAQMFFENELGEEELQYVDGDGNQVATADLAARISEGNTVVESLMPMNLRWTGHRDLDKADEVFVSKVLTLSQVYDTWPKMKEVKLSQFLGKVSPDELLMLRDMRGQAGTKSKTRSLEDDELEVTGAKIEDGDSRLDEPVLVTHYYKPQSRSYRDGFEAILIGDYLFKRSRLRYGIVPVAQFRCLDDPEEPLGWSLVDLLKDPQELLDFVNGQIIRFLQMMRRRWFVPIMSNVDARDLNNPTRSYIPFNHQAGPPIPEQVANIPQSVTNFAKEFKEEFNDEAGIHDTMAGKHVPGVSSGRHAEALRSGDETLLGMSRKQYQIGLERAGEIMLAIMQKEWKRERKVRFFSNRQYVERAFSNTSFGDTSKCVLKPGTLLMLTQAQKLETLFGYAEMGLLTPEELRKLAPLVDTAGISTTEDPHYIKARRENEVFLAGPPKKLVAAREIFEAEIERIEKEVEVATAVASHPGEENRSAGEIAAERLSMQAQAAEADFNAILNEVIPSMSPFEVDMKITGIHVVEHAAVLASSKADSLPRWWKEAFVGHWSQHFEVIQQAQQAQAQQGAA